MELPVNKCVCLDLPLADLKRLACELQLDFDGLRAWSGCCTACGLCEPYVRLMLETGATAFAVLSPAEAREIARRAQT